MTNATEAARQLEAYLQTYLTPEETVLAKRLQDVRSDWQSTVVDAGLKFAQAGDIAQLKPLIAGARPKLDAVVAVIDDLVQLQMDVGKALIDEQQGDYAMHFLWSLVLAIAAVVIASISVLLIIRRLGQSMQVLGHGMDEVAGGRFDSQVDLDRQDEFAPLMLALATLQTKLGYISISEHEARAALMREFDISVGQVLRQLAGSIDTLRGTAQSQSSVAGQVSGNADTVAASSSELNASIKEIASQATQVSDLARATAAQAAQSRETMNRLAKAAQEITAVAKLIAEIAEQTNLLALNATIEAARAGDVGRGFAVVAGEVKSLANQTQNATGDIGRKITAVQSDSAAAVKALEEVAASIDKLSGAAQSIAAAVEEQAAVVDEVARNAEQTSAAAKETGAAAKAVSDTSETMAQGNLALADAVEKFKKTSG
jgi:methyl-accepting chemotaxis protein